MKTVNLYSFEELAEDVQQKVLRDMYDINVHHYWWEFTYCDAKDIGCEISAFDIDRGNYIDFSADDVEETAKLILHNHGKNTDTYQLAKNFLAESERLEIEFDRVEAVYNKLSHKEDLYDYEQAILNSADSLLDKIDDQQQEIVDEFEQQLGECYLTMLRNEYECLTSEEAIKESIIANEYTFTADGKIW